MLVKWITDRSGRTARSERETTKMYTANTIARRRLDGWADRRRYFRRLREMARTRVEKPMHKLPEGELVREKE